MGTWRLSNFQGSDRSRRKSRDISWSGDSGLSSPIWILETQPQGFPNQSKVWTLRTILSRNITNYTIRVMIGQVHQMELESSDIIKTRFDLFKENVDHMRNLYQVDKEALTCLSGLSSRWSLARDTSHVISRIAVFLQNYQTAIAEGMWKYCHKQLSKY